MPVLSCLDLGIDGRYFRPQRWPGHSGGGPQGPAAPGVAMTEGILRLRPSTGWRGRSFDHLVGASEHDWWKFDAGGFGGLEIEDELELGRLFDGQVGGPGALENLLDIGGGTPTQVIDICGIVHQPAGSAFAVSPNIPVSRYSSAISAPAMTRLPGLRRPVEPRLRWV